MDEVKIRNQVEKMETRIKMHEENVAKLNIKKEDIKDDIDQDTIEDNITRLQYREEHLKNVISVYTNLNPTKVLEKEKSYVSNFSVNILLHLHKYLDMAINLAFPFLDFKSFAIINRCADKSKRPLYADYQCSSAFTLCKNEKIIKHLKNNGCTVINPNVVAKKIIENVPSSYIVDSVEISGYGFINIKISKECVKKYVKDILIYGVRPPFGLKRTNVIIDMSSPNIAKEMHVGHLRSTIIGDSISILLAFCGNNVKKINHVGDWGTQFGMLIAHLRDKYPQYVDKLPGISTLMSLYKESKIRFDGDNEFKIKAKQDVVQLQSYNPEYIKIWKNICEISRIEFNKIYRRLSVYDLQEMGESFYQKKMINIVKDLEQKGLTQQNDGRIISLFDDETPPLTIVKSDGGYTYDTSDIACVHYRIQVLKGNHLIYVIDSGQENHMKGIFKLATKAGYAKLNNGVTFQHVGFGVVCGSDNKRLKTRSGETTKLNDLLDEGVKKAREKLETKPINDKIKKEEFDNICDSIAYGCIKYADLSQTRTKDYVFSYDRMLEDKGNTALYLLYAYARICSIIRNTKYSESEIEQFSRITTLKLDHPLEMKLSKILIRFPETISKIIENFMMHILCEYIYELSTVFTNFYDACYITEIDKESNEKTINIERLLLVKATLKVMKKCFEILNINTLERM
ncbi:hypothetical protein A3Q56_07881 [Intoshia linei]|uniref:arginine--tRNA ligase n=1 Tax=Intoshia linei TaxID=1819745 RepID=A0A177ASA8_9BILA|nr:hypothetical protein A3Q56_07881 [Intoshia linei]